MGNTREDWGKQGRTGDEWGIQGGLVMSVEGKAKVNQS